MRGGTYAKEHCLKGICPGIALKRGLCFRLEGMSFGGRGVTVLYVRGQGRGILGSSRNTSRSERMEGFPCE